MNERSNKLINLPYIVLSGFSKAEAIGGDREMKDPMITVRGHYTKLFTPCELPLSEIVWLEDLGRYGGCYIHRPEPDGDYCWWTADRADDIIAQVASVNPQMAARLQRTQMGEVQQ